MNYRPSQALTIEVQQVVGLVKIQGTVKQVLISIQVIGGGHRKNLLS